MCGRFAQYRPGRDYARLAGIAGPICELPPRWNVAPSLPVAMLTARQGGSVEAVTWGLVPHWAKDPSTLNHPINARVETLAEKPMFRDPWRRGQRGLVPADGFYEWRVEQGRKQPWFIRRRDGEPLLLAALWDHWEALGEQPIDSCVLIVGAANELVAPLHERMPVIVQPIDAERWLDSKVPPDQLTDLLTPCPVADLQAYRVSTKVNNARNEGPELIAPV